MQTYHVVADVLIGLVNENTGIFELREFNGAEIDWRFANLGLLEYELHEMRMWKEAGFKAGKDETILGVEQVDLISLAKNPYDPYENVEV